MQNITRTVLSAALQTTQLLGKPLIITPNSTLNQKFDIQANLTVSESDDVAMRYVSIGNGGHRMKSGVGGVSIPEPVQHTPRDAALYNHLPFVLRLPTNDLDAGARTKYRLRRFEQHDGVTYVAYYLKMLDTSLTAAKLELRTVTGGVTSSTDFVHTLSDLSPTPPAIGPGAVLVTSGDYIASTAKVPFTMTVSDITEFLNVCNIIYGDEAYAIISEIALCSGADRNVTGDFNGVSLGYTEAIAVQVCTFVNTMFSALFSNDGIVVNFDVGNVEPLLVLS